MTGKRRAGRTDKPASPQTPKPPPPKPEGLGAATVTPSGRRAQKSRSKPPPAPPTQPPTPTPPQKTAASTIAPVSGSRTTRRAVREQEQQNRKRRTQVLVAIVVVAAIVAGLLFWWLTKGDNAAPSTTPAGRTAHSLTMTLAQPGQDATSGVLLVADSTEQSADGVLIPSNVYVTGPVPDGVPFGETVLLASVDAPGMSLANTLNVIVDGTWQLSPEQLAALVDSVDGVLVDVDTDIVVDKKIVIAAGDGLLLNGKQAAEFAQYKAPGEPEESRLARFSQVVDQLIRRLPDSADSVTTMLAQDKATDLLTGPPEDLSDFLVTFGEVARSGDAGFETLPTQPLPLIKGPDASVPDDDAVQQLRTTTLAGIVPESVSGEQITVLVQNGVGTPGIEQTAAKQLTNAGYEFRNGGNASHFGYDKSIVVIPDTTAASIAVGNSVADALGLPASSVKVTNQGSAMADVIVILGGDYKP